MISKFFIDRPVLANVIAVLTVVVGLVSLLRLPVSQYPNVVPPTVQVTARYPGASATTIARDLALPIEEQVNGVEGMLYMSSTCTSDGLYSLTVTFAIGTDPDKAQILVQNRVSAALPQLPSSVQTQGVQTAKRSTSILEIVALTSPGGKYDSLFLSNYATIHLVDEISRIDGVGSVSVFGAGQYALRLWLDPQKMQSRNLVPNDIYNVVSQQSLSTSAGQIGAPPAPPDQSFQYTVNVASKLSDVGDFENLIVKAASNSGGPVTRLKDVARVELGAQQYSQAFKINGQPAAGMAIFQLPNANALDVAERVEARMEALAKAFPEGMTWSTPFNTTLFVKASIHDVYKTLIEAAILVLVVILAFLQDWRATLVPATTVPVTIIGAFAAMDLLGFTVNMTTLFAVVLAIGIVVDDAIVIVEGAAHHIERGLSPHDAAVQAMKELLGPVIGITLVLMAVFVPAAFMPGLSGQMYRQFALVIAATALISAINAMTLKPTQCALWLRAAAPMDKRNVFFRGFNAVYGRAESGYAKFISGVAHHSFAALVVALALEAGAVYLLARVPTAFLPVEDQGYFLVSMQLPEGASLQRTTRAMDVLAKRLEAAPAVETVVAISGLSALNDNASLANGAVAYVILKDWSTRGPGQDLLSLYTSLSKASANLDDGLAIVLPPPPIQGIGNASGATMKVELRDGSFDYEKLQALSSAITERASSQSDFSVAMSSFRSDAPQFDVNFNRVKAETIGVPYGTATGTLGAYLGSSYVGQFSKFGHVFQIYMQADSQSRADITGLQTLSVRNNSGDMAPLGTLAEVGTTPGPSIVSLYNLYPAATVVANPARGVSSGQAISLLEEIAQRTLGPDAGYDWSAMSFQEKAVGGQIYIVYAMGLLLVYLVLAGQYESWIAPLAVILSVPLALLGTAATLWAVGAANSLYTQIGMVLLIALASKNAILIVEFARDQRNHEGRDIIASAVEAARLRFRPILMTSFAFILGVGPLAFASGAGSSAQRSIGIAVLTGMLSSTLLTVTFAPSLFIVMQRLEEWRGARKAAEPATAAAQTQTGAV